MTSDPIEWRCTQEQAFMDALTQTISTAFADNSKVAVLSIKMTGLRKLRGIYGRSFMEKAAKAIHERIGHILRPGDQLQPLGNCEFLLCLPRIKNTGHMRLAVSKLLRELDRAYELGETTATTPAVIGAALYPDTTQSPVELINAAEFALAQARENGEQFRVSDPITAESQALWDVEEEFRHAIQNDELLLFYQPQVDLSTGRVDGVEALIRWQHPKRGLVSPGLFIPVIEQTELIHKVTHWALHRALREQKEWLAKGHDISVSVNVAGKNFSEPSFREIVLNALSLWGAPGQKLILEITESELMDNLDQVGSELEALRDAGVRVSIDDFGTGYSSLSYLSRLPVDEIKIDRSFIQNMAQQEQDERIVIAIIQLAREFQTSILAEGIEDQESYDKLRELGCGLGQGYLMSRPIPHEELMSFLDVQQQ